MAILTDQTVMIPLSTDTAQRGTLFANRGSMVGRYDKRRANIRRRAQQPPWDFPRGLAHVLATVAEPRSDDAAHNAAFNAYVDEHREQLIKGISAVIPPDNASEPAGEFGGQVEDVLDHAADRLKHVAQEHGIRDVIERLARLEDERRLGLSDAEYTVDDTDLSLDLADIQRSTVSNRRIGLWR